MDLLRDLFFWLRSKQSNSSRQNLFFLSFPPPSPDLLKHFYHRLQLHLIVCGHCFTSRQNDFLACLLIFNFCFLLQDSCSSSRSRIAHTTAVSIYLPHRLYKIKLCYLYTIPCLMQWRLPVAPEDGKNCVPSIYYISYDILHPPYFNFPLTYYFFIYFSDEIATNKSFIPILLCRYSKSLFSSW